MKNFVQLGLYKSLVLPLLLKTHWIVWAPRKYIWMSVKWVSGQQDSYKSHLSFLNIFPLPMYLQINNPLKPSNRWARKMNTLFYDISIECEDERQIFSIWEKRELRKRDASLSSKTAEYRTELIMQSTYLKTEGLSNRILRLIMTVICLRTI